MDSDVPEKLCVTTSRVAFCGHQLYSKSRNTLRKGMTVTVIIGDRIISNSLQRKQDDKENVRMSDIGLVKLYKKVI